MEYFTGAISNLVYGVIGSTNKGSNEPCFDLLRPEVALKVYLFLWIAQAFPFPFNIVFSRVGVLVNLGASLAIMSSMSILEGAYSRRVLANQNRDSSEKVYLALGNLYLLGIILPIGIGPTRLFYFHAIHNILPLWLVKMVPVFNTFL